IEMLRIEFLQDDLVATTPEVHERRKSDRIANSNQVELFGEAFARIDAAVLRCTPSIIGRWHLGVLLPGSNSVKLANCKVHQLHLDREQCVIDFGPERTPVDRK